MGRTPEKNPTPRTRRRRTAVRSDAGRRSQSPASGWGYLPRPRGCPHVAQHVERVLQIGWVRAGYADTAAVGGMNERQRARMQPLPLQPKFFGEVGIGSIGQVARARMVERRKMHPNLVGATGFEVDI